ncbi:MAG: hypothetical protein JXR96_23935 [Deltaproteobacteria bacterium]|nr:hypothetical protein [Deltaproteobacteria bacterium]
MVLHVEHRLRCCNAELRDEVADPGLTLGAGRGMVERMQRIVVFEQGQAGRRLDFIRARGRGVEIARVVSLARALPAVIDRPTAWLPSDWQAELAISYLQHPDLAEELARLCAERGVPLVASGMRLAGPGAFCPPICCALKADPRLGAYGRQFGAPALLVKRQGGRIAHVEVQRGAPCGASWEAARAVCGLPADEAVARFGLEVQLRCQADGSTWDPLWGKSPIHLAGQLHAAALGRALEP